MTDTDEFFVAQQGAAVLKHGIIWRYPRVFLSKTGRYAAGHRVVHLDGYAGAGAYDDGTEGSPVIVARTALELAKTRNVVGLYVEKDPDMYDRLVKALAQIPDHEARTYRGTVEEHLEDLLREAGDSPLFAFLDPFGLGLPFDMLTQKVMARSNRAGGFRAGPPTEILLNFSLPGLRRTAGHLMAKGIDPRYLRARETIIAKVDGYLGGDYWRSIWASNGQDRLERIVSGYVNRLHHAAGRWSYWSVPVSDRWEGPPVYILVFLTQHADGFWYFHECLSSAKEDFYQWSHSGQLDLEPLGEREGRWTSEIQDNIVRLLDSGRFRVREKVAEVYGRALGWAREKHVRAAIKQLHEEGKTPTVGVGDIPSMVIEPAPQAALF